MELKVDLLGPFFRFVVYRLFQRSLVPDKVYFRRGGGLYPLNGRLIISRLRLKHSGVFLLFPLERGRVLLRFNNYDLVSYLS